MAQYLVTGGAGFIGSHVARSLVAEGHTVVVTDNLSTGKRENVPSEAEFVKVDLTEASAFDTLPKIAYDGVVHLAAQSSGAIGQKDPYRDCQVNTMVTVRLAQWCLAHDVPRFIYASSMTVYGGDSTGPTAEDMPCQPISYYGVSKLASEHYLRVAAVEGLRPTVLRLYSVYGPGQNLGNLYQGMASIYLAYLLRGATVPVTGSLERYRDFVYVSDVIDAFLAALRRPSCASPSYNVGSGQKTTVRQLLGALIAHMGLPTDHPIDEQEGSPNDVFGSVADIRRIERELDWRPKTSLDDGLGQMVAWAKTQ